MPDPKDQPAKANPARPRGAAVQRSLVAAVGITVTLLGLAFATIAAVDLGGGGDGTMPLGSYVGLIVLFLALAAWGARIVWRPLGLPSVDELDLRRLIRRHIDPISTSITPSNPVGEERRRRILQLAEQEHGRVTVLETAAHCTVTSDEAKVALDALVLDTVAEMHVSEAGVLVYVFPQYLSRADRGRRRRQQK